MSWQDSLTFIESPVVEHRVGDRTVGFRPISVQTLFKLRRIAKPFAKALPVLLDGGKNDVKSEIRDFPGEGAVSIVEAIDPKLAQIRHDQRERAWQSLFEEGLHDETLAVLGEIVLKSCGRSLFGENERDWPTPQAFMAEPQVAACFGDLIAGTLKANKGVLGPLGRSLDDLAAKAKAFVEGRMKTQTPDSETSPTGSPGSSSEDTTPSESSPSTS